MDNVKLSMKQGGRRELFSEGLTIPHDSNGRDTKFGDSCSPVGRNWILESCLSEVEVACVLYLCTVQAFHRRQVIKHHQFERNGLKLVLSVFYQSPMVGLDQRDQCKMCDVRCAMDGRRSDRTFCAPGAVHPRPSLPFADLCTYGVTHQDPNSLPTFKMLLSQLTIP